MLSDKIKDALVFLQEHGQTNQRAFALIIERTVSILVEDRVETASVQLSEINRDSMTPRQKMLLSFHNLYLSLLFDENDLKERCEEFICSQLSSCVVLYVYAVFAFIAGLASFKVYRQTKEAIWASRGREFKQKVQQWAEQGLSWNFQHCYLLLAAEECYSDGDFLRAEGNYKNAIVVAKAHKFINHAALVSTTMPNGTSYGHLLTFIFASTT